MSAHNIPPFWSWFEDNLGRLRNVVQNPSHPDREYIVNSLDQYILAIGMFTWDIEAGTTKPWSLVISPNGDPELLELSRAIVEQAPELTDWEFYPARPRKAQPLKFIVYDEATDQQQVDATSWRYVLLPKGEGQFSLTIEAGNNRHLSEETLYKAADYLATCLTGEETRIMYIPRLRVVEELSEEHRQVSKPISELWQELADFGDQ